MIPRKHMDFLKALKNHDLAAEAKFYDLLSKQEPKRASFGGFGGKVTDPDDPYCPRCGKYLYWFIDDCKYCPECGQAISWEREESEF